MAASSRDVRRELGHGVLDVDGHVIEFMPAIMPYLREALGPKLFDRYVNQPSPIAKILGADTATRLPAAHAAVGVVGHPGRRTPRDLATGAIPGLHVRAASTSSASTTRCSTRPRASASPASTTTSCAIGVCRGFNDVLRRHLRAVRATG